MHVVGYLIKKTYICGDKDGQFEIIGQGRAVLDSSSNYEDKLYRLGDVFVTKRIAQNSLKSIKRDDKDPDSSMYEIVPVMNNRHVDITKTVYGVHPA